ncbi:CHAD domain-containing protein [Flaviflexus salsibiostraticola]|uniref:CHAD domain-containing protein n=2 Tax=Flaviflexus salsibiostraticola TaxID=1282737 RepID=A0A3Q8WUH4_9ACTO|nr:CHAD domain-containing protein [Flaviflexus salsibiostraticola]
MTPPRFGDLSRTSRSCGLELRMGAFDDHTVPPEALSWSSGIATRPHFHIQSDEPLALAVRRVILEQVFHGLQIQHPGRGNSNDRDHGFDQSVHELRKSIKRARAVLRLVRSEIGEKRYRHENTLLRDTARMWGPTRDAVVLAKLAEKVFPELELDDHVKDDIVTTLRIRAEASTRAARLDEQRLTDTAVALHGFAGRIYAVPTEGPGSIPDTWDSIEPGISLLARRVVRRRDKAVAKPTTERLHAWRRSAKYLGYLTSLLHVEPSDSDIARARSQSARNGHGEDPLLELHELLSQLGSLLGDDHDLAVLIETLGRDPLLLPDSVNAAHLFWELTQLRRELQAKAFEVGEKLGDTKSIVATISAAWRGDQSVK